MKLRNIIKEIILEYKEVIDLPQIEKAKESKSDIHIIWNNGILAPSDKMMDLMTKSGGMNQIGARLNFSGNEISFFMMDDWSDFKGILRMQQFIKDLIRLKIIDASWGLKITDKKSTKINIKGSKVKDILNYDAQFTEEIPYAFHGTADVNLEEIKRFGLTPNSGVKNWDLGYTKESKKNNYLTIDFARAEYYAHYAVEHLKKVGIKSKPVVIEFHNIPIENVMSDDDFLTNMGKLHLINFLTTGKKTTINNYIKGIRNSSQFAFRGRIPANLIKKIYKV